MSMLRRGAIQPWSSTMKKMILSVALAALVASPALAQATRMLRQAPDYASQRIMSGNQAAQYGYAPGIIVEGGRIIGQDPDRNVQLQLKRDPVADN
jgi:hypothetical protein